MKLTVGLNSSGDIKFRTIFSMYDRIIFNNEIISVICSSEINEIKSLKILVGKYHIIPVNI